MWLLLRRLYKVTTNVDFSLPQCCFSPIHCCTFTENGVRGERGERGGGEIKGIWDKHGTLFQNIAIPKVMWQCFVMDYELHENDNTQKS